MNDINDIKQARYDHIVKKFENILKCGIECDYGWFDLIERVCFQISKRVETLQYSDFKIIQIKEKFGQLRIYTTFSDDYISGVISLASSISLCTCEVCGNKGSIDPTNQWIRTLCDDCKNHDK